MSNQVTVYSFLCVQSYCASSKQQGRIIVCALHNLQLIHSNEAELRMVVIQQASTTEQNLSLQPSLSHTSSMTKLLFRRFG